MVVIILLLITMITVMIRREIIIVKFDEFLDTYEARVKHLHSKILFLSRFLMSKLQAEFEDEEIPLSASIAPTCALHL